MSNLLNTGLFDIGLASALGSAALALLVLGITRIWKNPHLAHALWLLVLLKLVTPPLLRLPLPINFPPTAAAMPTAAIPVRVDPTEPSFQQQPQQTESSPEHDEAALTAPVFSEIVSDAPPVVTSEPSPLVEIAPEAPPTYEIGPNATDSPETTATTLAVDTADTTIAEPAPEPPAPLAARPTTSSPSTDVTPLLTPAPTAQSPVAHASVEPTTSSTEPPLVLPGAVPEADPTPSQRIPSQPHRAWRPFVGSAWLAGTLFWTLVVILRIARFQRVLAKTDKAPEHLQTLAQPVATALGLRHVPNLRVADSRISPLVWPVGRPTVVMPRQLLEQLSDEELQAILAHELAHLARRDHWTRWLEATVAVLYWWNPVMWLARTRLHTAEEICCDALVLDRWLNANPRPYAHALLKIADFSSGHLDSGPALASGIGTQGRLTRRIEMLLQDNTPRRLPALTKLALLLTALAILPLSVWAVQPEEDTSQPDTSASKPAPPSESETIVTKVPPDNRATPPQLAPTPNSSTPHVTKPVDQRKIVPGEWLRIRATGTPQQYPIGGFFLVYEVTQRDKPAVKGVVSLEVSGPPNPQPSKVFYGGGDRRGTHDPRGPS